MKRRLLAAVLFAAVTVLGFAASAGAVDGVSEINQAKVLAAGGFPYQINAAGSYRLTSNLLPTPGASAIVVNNNNVTIDLNGFTIWQVNSGGTGIDSSSHGPTTVENGIVTGFATGISTSSNAIIRNVQAISNSGIGIYLSSPNGLVEGCTANNNVYGLYCYNSCRLVGNVANNNSTIGIVCALPGCLISGNTANYNSGNAGIVCNSGGCTVLDNVAEYNYYGIYTGTTNGTSIIRNTMVGNTFGAYFNDTTSAYGEDIFQGNSVSVTGGTSLHTNLCNGAAC
jgi:parallel beta-helix repeat protein